MELLKLLSGSEIVAQIAGFIVLLALLRVFAWKRIIGLLDKRREYIASELKAIDDSKADIEKIKLEYGVKLSAIEETAKVRLHEALNESKVILEDARKSANLQAQEMIESARKSVKYELAKARDALKDEIIDLTLKAAENVIKEKLTAEGDRKLVKEFLEDIDKIE